MSNTVFLMVIERPRKTRLNLIKNKKYLDSDLSVSSSYLVYSRLKPSLVSVLISVSISVSISVPISFRGQTRYGLGLISKKPSSLKKKPSFFQVKTEVKTKDHSVFYAGSWLFEYRVGPQGPMTLGMDSKATISGAKKDNISKKSRHEAIRIAIIRQATKDWIIAPTYRNTANMDADVLTKPLTMANLLYFYPRALPSTFETDAGRDKRRGTMARARTTAARCARTPVCRRADSPRRCRG